MVQLSAKDVIMLQSVLRKALTILEGEPVEKPASSKRKRNPFKGHFENTAALGIYRKPEIPARSKGTHKKLKPVT